MTINNYYSYQLLLLIINSINIIVVTVYLCAKW